MKIKKDKVIILISIVLMIIIVVLLGATLYFFNSNEPALQENIENISYEMVYETNNMILVRDYDTFYNLEKVIKNVVNDLNEENYEKLLLNVSDSYMNRIGKDQVLKKMKEFSVVVKGISYEEFDYSKLLYQVYQMEENKYNCLINIDGQIYYFLMHLDSEYETIEILNFILSEEVG